VRRPAPSHRTWEAVAPPEYVARSWIGQTVEAAPLLLMALLAARIRLWRAGNSSQPSKSETGCLRKAARRPTGCLQSARCRADQTRVRASMPAGLSRLFRFFMASYAPLALILAVQRSEGIWPPWHRPAFWAFTAIGLIGLVDAYRLPRGALRKGHIRVTLSDLIAPSATPGTRRSAVYPPLTRALLRGLATHDLVRDICGISGV
jgi:hypothetical protein